MRKSRFADEQMVAILRGADRSPSAEVAVKRMAPDGAATPEDRARA